MAYRNTNFSQTVYPFTLHLTVKNSAIYVKTPCPSLYTFTPGLPKIEASSKPWCQETSLCFRGRLGEKSS